MDIVAVKERMLALGDRKLELQDQLEHLYAEAFDLAIVALNAGVSKAQIADLLFTQRCVVQRWEKRAKEQPIDGQRTIDDELGVPV